MVQKKDSHAGVVASNRRARYDYDVVDTIETGLVLKGSEVKSLRAGKASVTEAYAVVEEGELFVYNLHIPPYENNSLEALNPVRRRKLLASRTEIGRLARAVEVKGMTLVPLRLYFKNGYAKLELGLARGKRQYDKRETIKKRDEARTQGQD